MDRLVCIVIIPAVLALVIFASSASFRAIHQHPIEDLIQAADKRFHTLLASQARTYEQAIEAYKQRRHRCPPPGFASWFARANQSNAIIVEEFWDQIYADLEPFWGEPATSLRRLAFALSHSPRLTHEGLEGIWIRNGRVSVNCPEFSENLPCQAQMSMLQSIEHLLPDMDVAVNVHASPRLFVPWERIEGARQEAKIHRTVPYAIGPANHMYSASAKFELSETAEIHGTFDHDTSPIQVAAKACPPWSPARASANSTHAELELHHGGVLSDFRNAKSVCNRPELMRVHGALILPNLVSTSDRLLPLLASTHIAGVSAEITVPPMHYWAELPSFSPPSSGFDTRWEDKRDDVFWRGTNTGGRHDSRNWRAFHRHRFVAFTNSTYLRDVVRGAAHDWASVRVPQGTALASLADWASTHLDTAFVSLRCAHTSWDTAPACPYLDGDFSVRPAVSLRDMAKHKYLPDVDGNAFSARFRALLMSGSVPIKATIFDEWHDTRLVPWKHFIPIDAGLGGDFWLVLCFFLGGCSDGEEGHDALASSLAAESQRWAQAVLRKEDIELYWLRLLLEYARVVDDKRGVLTELGCRM